MMRVDRLLRAGLLALGVFAGGLALGCPAALAGTGHGPLSGSFGSATSPVPDPYPLSVPLFGVAVDNDPASPSQGDVYVADSSNNRVEWFDSAGKYEGQFNGSGTFEVKGKVKTGTAAPGGPFSNPKDVAVDPHTGDVWVAAGGVVDKFDPEGEYAGVQLTGTPEGAFGEAWSVAVDPKSGDVYVADERDRVVDKFTSSGVFRRQFPAGICCELGIAVDSEGNVYVSENDGVHEFSSAGVFQPPVLSGGESTVAGDVAVDPSSGDLYVNLPGREVIQVFRKRALIYQFGSPLGESLGLAVSLSGTIYASEFSAGDVKIFAAGATANEPKTEAATSVEGTTATLNGELRGGESGYYFAYNDNGGCLGGGKTPTPEGAATGTKNESALVEGLEPNTQYTFCLVATNAYGPEFGPPAPPFTTKPVAPLVEGVSVPSIGPGEATLKAKVNPENWTAACWVEYGETTAYGTEAFCEPGSVAGHGEQLATLQLEGLQASTVYHYRVVAENPNKQKSAPSEGTGEFETAPEPTPVIETESVSPERKAESGTGLEATLEANVNPEGRPTTSCAFQYVTEETFNKTGFTGTPPSVPCEQSPAQIGEGHKGKTVSAKAAGLRADVDYHFRAVVANKTYPVVPGADEVFGPPAEVTTGAVLSNVPGVAPGTTATVGGTLNPEGVDTRCYVQYGKTEAYGQIAPYPLPSAVEELRGLHPPPAGLDAGSGTAPVVLGGAGGPPDVTFEGLAAGATYHYRLVAYNADGTVYGADMTVKVLPAPQVGPASVSEISQESATIATSVDPEGLHTLYKLDVGTSTAYGTPYPGDAGSGSAPVALTFKLSGLEPGTTYHFRLVASNGDGSSSEGDQTFTTAPTPPPSPPVIEVPPSLSLVPFTGPAWPKQTGTTTTETNARKLAKALKACRAKRGKKRRAACIKQAHKRYGPAKKAKKGAHKSR
jgi:hypothetical protein